MRAHPVPVVATGMRAAPNPRRRWAWRGARLRYTWAPPGSRQGAVRGAHAAIEHHQIARYALECAPRCPHAQQSHARCLWWAWSRGARCQTRPTACCGCTHSCALQSTGHCALNFGPILLKLKYVMALAPAVGVVAPPAAAELDAPCYPIRAPQIGSFYARSTAGCCRSH